MMNRKTHSRPASAGRFRATAIAMLLMLTFTASVTCQTKRRPSEPQLRSFEFDTVRVNSRGQITDRRKGQARSFVENLRGVELEMVEIPAGTFQMGTSAAQAEQENKLTEQTHGIIVDCSWEMPQHEVEVPAFYIGKYEVTQAQWKAVANLPKVNLKLDPDPSHSEGDNLPVERVSWDDAMEFCARLSKATGRMYRLPTEAEWEYACRAGTTTAFAFGENITKELASKLGESPVGAIYGAQA